MKIAVTGMMSVLVCWIGINGPSAVLAENESFDQRIQRLERTLEALHEKVKHGRALDVTTVEERLEKLERK